MHGVVKTQILVGNQNKEIPTTYYFEAFKNKLRAWSHMADKFGIKIFIVHKLFNITFKFDIFSYSYIKFSFEIGLGL